MMDKFKYGSIVVIDDKHVGKVVDNAENHPQIADGMVGIFPPISSPLAFEWIDASHCIEAPLYLRFAWQCGGEAVANGSRRALPNLCERQDIARYAGVSGWTVMPLEYRNLALQAFAHGRRSAKRSYL